MTQVNGIRAFYRQKIKPIVSETQYRLVPPWLRYLKHSRFPQSTYSQHHEDLVILELLGTVRSFIDIGAYDGFMISNTFLFSLHGAAGLCFEPVKNTFDRLQQLYKFIEKIICIQVGVSNEPASLEIRCDEFLSSLEVTANTHHRDLAGFNPNSPINTITVRPLVYWLDKYSQFRTVDVISIDVEGHELHVMKGIDLSKFRPRLFVIETHAQHNELKHDSEVQKLFEEIDGMMQDAGYVAILHNITNTFWLRGEEVNQDKLKALINRFPEYKLALP